MFTGDADGKDRKKFLVKKMSLPINDITNLSQKEAINKAN